MYSSGYDALAANPESGETGDAELFALPASYAQRRLWFLDQWSPASSAYNVPDAFQLSGRLRVDTLERALNAIVERHEILRTTFAFHAGALVQVIVPEGRLPLSRVDLGPDGDIREALRLASDEANRPFDLGRGPLIRATLYGLTETEHVLLIVSHHIVTDGWSVGVLMRELSQLYAAFNAGDPSPLPELPIQYADFALWQHEWLQGELLEEQLTYWRRQLAGQLPTLHLPVTAPRSEALSEAGAVYTVDLPRELAGSLLGLAQREDVTLFMLMLVGLAALLDRYAGQHEVIIGAPIANRNRVEVENLIGFFANTLPLRLDLSGDPTTREALRRAREVCLGAYSHQDVPFERLVDAIQPERDPGVTPLFQVALTVDRDMAESFTLDGLTVRPLDVELNAAKFDLTLSVVHTNDGLSASFNYRSELFEADTIRRMAGHFQTALEGMVAHPDRALSLLPDGELEYVGRIGKVDGRALPAPAARSASSEVAFVAPSTPTQVELAHIWADVLDLDRVSIHDNFFLLGGDSISSVRVLALARERSLPVTLQQLFRHQTIESLSHELERSIADEGALPELVPLQTTGSRRPLFLVHAAGGGVMGYAELARALGADQPVYGLQARGLADSRMAETSVESMARTYAQAILSVQPHGPYHLGGWSLGGVIAFELAQLLRRRGETVAGLVLLDTWAPAAGHVPAEDDLLRMFAANLAGQTGLDLSEVELSACATQDERLAALLRAMREHSTLSTELTFLDVQELFRVFAANVAATAAYRPTMYANPVLLMRATESDEPLNVRLGWSEEIVPELQTVTVPGDHFTILRAPHLHKLARRLRHWLAAAQRLTASV